VRISKLVGFGFPGIVNINTTYSKRVQAVGVASRQLRKIMGIAVAHFSLS
jgi:hypothetical protein